MTTPGADAGSAAASLVAMPQQSVVIPVRNRAGLRLDNCLRSLRWQEGLAAPLEIVIVDFGSDAAEAATTAEAATAHDARLVRVDEGGLWNRARALNFGIRAATGAFVVCTDADMIFSPRFFADIQRVLDADAAHALVFCRCHDLPEGAADRAIEIGEFDTLRARAALRETHGTGACQAARRSFFEAVRGYDEGFVYWGAEDDDMRLRAQRYGMRPVWLDDGAAMLHQWHPTTKNDRPLRRRWNSWRLKLLRWKVVRNDAGWGRARAGG